MLHKQQEQIYELCESKRNAANVNRQASRESEKEKERTEEREKRRGRWIWQVVCLCIEQHGECQSAV